MKKLLLFAIGFVTTTFVYGSKLPSDSVSIKYYLTPARNYQETMPSFALFIKINDKKYYLQRVMLNSKKGDAAPDIVYNKKKKRSEYLLKTWFAGAGANFKAYVTGSKETSTATVMVYVQDIEEQAPDSKWRLIKAVKL